MYSFRKRSSSKKNNKSRKSTKKQNNKRRKFTKKNNKHNKRRIIKGGAWYSKDKLKNLHENYEPLMKLFNKVLDAKYEDTICDLYMGACAWSYPFHKNDHPEIERLTNKFNELYMWTTNTNPLNLSDDQMNKARKMKTDIEANLNRDAYIALITKDKKNAEEDYPEFDNDFR